MKKIKTILFLLVALLCGCAENDQAETAIVSEETMSTSESAVTTESITVTFAETENAVSEETTTETKAELKENMLEYSGKNLYAVMEFTGAESLLFHPEALSKQDYREDDYVLHTVLYIENKSRKDFDFVPQKILIRGRNGNSSWTMHPVTENDTGLAASDRYYTVASGESISIEIDFVGKKDCIQYANEILYDPELHSIGNNIDAKKLNNVRAANEFHITRRNAIKKAVRKALDESASVPLPFQFVPSDGEYTLNTEKNSYCIDIDHVVPEGYVSGYMRMRIKVHCLTGEPETFEGNRFSLVNSDGKKTGPTWYNFDESTAKTVKPNKEVIIDGEKVIFYDFPFGLCLHPDGTAEYEMYYHHQYGEEYVKLVYDGESDRFEKEINEKCDMSE